MEAQGKRLTTYENWMREEGIPIVEGHGVEDVTTLPREPWKRLGGRGTFIHLQGMEGKTGLYLAEIAPGGGLGGREALLRGVDFYSPGKGIHRGLVARGARPALRMGKRIGLFPSVEYLAPSLQWYQ